MRILHALTEALAARGHDLARSASGDPRSSSSARLVAPIARAIRHEQPHTDALPSHLRMLAEAFRGPGRFDVLPIHKEYSLRASLETPDWLTLFRVLPQ